MNSRQPIILVYVAAIVLLATATCTLAWIHETETADISMTTATQGFTLMEVDGTEYVSVTDGRNIKPYNGSEDPQKDRSIALDGNYVLWSNFGYIGTLYLKDGSGNTLATFTFPNGTDYLTSSEAHIDTEGQSTLHLEI